MTEQQKKPFEIKKIYLKDASLESPMSPVVFTQEFKPQLNVEFDNPVTKVEGQENIYEVVVRLTVTCKQDDKVTYICEVKQAGVFEINMVEDQTTIVTNGLCPTIVFPYASEAINSLVVKAGFPPVVLPPINFEALYAQRKAQEEAKQ